MFSRDYVRRCPEKTVQDEIKELEKKMEDMQRIMNMAAKITRCCTKHSPQLEAVEYMRTLSVNAHIIN